MIRLVMMALVILVVLVVVGGDGNETKDETKLRG